jgi:5-methylcytosine-specific restriction endonuclease McrA
LRKGNRDIRFRLWFMQGTRCYLCGKPTDFKRTELDHRIPLALGGTNEESNLAVACVSCNNRKAARAEDEYRALGIA